jgi:hypothetical protein
MMGFWQHTHIQLWNWLPTTMSQYQQQLVLLIMYNIIFAPGNEIAFLVFIIFDCSSMVCRC